MEILVSVGMIIFAIAFFYVYFFGISNIVL